MNRDTAVLPGRLGFTALLVVVLWFLQCPANANEAALEIVLPATEYQPDDDIGGTLRVTTYEARFHGHVRVAVIDPTSGLRVSRLDLPLHVRDAGVKTIAFALAPLPVSDAPYRLVATVVENCPPDAIRRARAVEHFSVVLATTPIAQLPAWMRYCDEPTCGGKLPVVVRACPESNASCSPRRKTTVVPRVDGRQVDQILLPINGPDMNVALLSGPGWVQGSAVVALSGTVIVRSDVDVTLSYYDVAPVWGGETDLDFVSELHRSRELVSTVYRHPTYLLNDEGTELHERGRVIIAAESGIAGIYPGRMHAYFAPSEFSTIGEGNFSDGMLNITMNYGNPPYIDAIGSVFDVVMPRFAHEYVHELFSEVTLFSGNTACLNEGLADAFAFAAGFLPEGDFGPMALRNLINFDDGCSQIANDPEVHDVGNCTFWQVYRMGLLSQSFVANVLHPKRAFAFDSCNLRSLHTGNTLLVLFSEAAGRDMADAIDMAQIPNAGSYEAAKQALGI